MGTNTDDALITIGPITVLIVLIACCVYCCCKCCKCCKRCCKQPEEAPVIVDSHVIQPLSPTVQHLPPPPEAQQSLMPSPPPSYYPAPQYPMGPIPYPQNTAPPPMSYYPQQPGPHLSPMGGQLPYPTVNYNPLVPPNCPLPPIPVSPQPSQPAQRAEPLNQQPEFNPNYVPTAPPP